jgi:hypothetical protein
MQYQYMLANIKQLIFKIRINYSLRLVWQVFIFKHYRPGNIVCWPHHALHTVTRPNVLIKNSLLLLYLKKFEFITQPAGVQCESISDFELDKKVKKAILVTGRGSP